MIKSLFSNKQLVHGSQDYGQWTCIGWGHGKDTGVWLISCGHIVFNGGPHTDCSTCKKFYEINGL